MPAPGEDGGVELDIPAPREWTVTKQRVDLDVDFPGRSLKGSTEITIEPLSRDLRQVRLHCRQCKPTSIQVGGMTARWEYFDPYQRATMSNKSTVQQHGMLKSRIESSLRPSPEPQLLITLPAKIKITEIFADPKAAQPLVNGHRQDGDATAAAETPAVEKAPFQMHHFQPIKMTIEFEVSSFRDGIHWIGCDEGDKRYPYLYTKVEQWPGTLSHIFPCLDDATSRCSWEIAIRCPRTLGDAFRKSKAAVPGISGSKPLVDSTGDVEMLNGSDGCQHDQPAKGRDEYFINLNEEDAVLELAVLCVGEVASDIIDTEDDTRHTVTFSLDTPVTARHVAFAIGPFEHVDLATSRDSGGDAKAGQTGFRVDGYCLPGRAEEVDNTCFPICQALDYLNVEFGRFPFSSYQLLFVDDAICNTAGAAGLSICSTRLLFPADIIEPLHKNTRVLIRALADQWSGVNIVPNKPEDAWAVAGIAGYMTDHFMKKLAGNNQYRWEQKLASERVYDLDADRPSIHQLGPLLHLDPSIREFLDLKSGLVLGILDRRLVKTSGSTGVKRIITKIMLTARSSDGMNNLELSTEDFKKVCERLGHNKLDSFFKQWVHGAGVPIFYCTQRFNKKKLVVEMTIQQMQLARETKPAFEPGNFMREIKEHVQEVWAPEPMNVFTGPMTIRIHEADGTPYEHIVEIKEALTKLEIPYNTKYKRLKRSKRQKERAVADGNAEGEGEGGSLLYCLGDILDTEGQIREWKLEDWSKEDEDKMGQESYEWIRMDADFEWIGKIHLTMPLYMYISQLQQDRDLVAQYESMRYLLASNPHHISLSILVRTLMDDRYFYGIRVMAAEGIAQLAKDRLLDIGRHHLTKAFAEMFCEDDQGFMPRPNDFSSRVNFIMQCAIPKAMVLLRDEDGRVPKEIRQFFVDKLKFNDNSDNAFSDCHYVATLMHCLADSLVASHRLIQTTAPAQPTYEFNFGEEEPDEPEEPEEPFNPDADFELMAVNEIERYRRIDEWVLTYQNIYSTTAIECLQKLSKAEIVKDKTKELLQYTRPSTADNVRLVAFRCMNELGLTRRMPMMKHLLFSLIDDRSPYFRDQMLLIFGEALGHIALGGEVAEKATLPAVPAEGLVLEQEVSGEARKLEVMRKATPEGALVALKATLQNEEMFKQALWYAATSPDIAIDEVGAFCDIAALMFDAVTSHMVMLKLPRPYRCAHEGRGKIRFYQQGAYRKTPSRGLAWDDYEELEALNLRYTGPLADDTKRRLEYRAMESRKAQAQEQIRVNTSISMPPPVLSAPLATPVNERSGIKLSLGGLKRKSTDGPAVESTPKSIKLTKTSTPSASRKPSFAGKPSKVIVLEFGMNSMNKVRSILSSPPRPGRGMAGLSPTSSFQQSSRLVSPGAPQPASSFAQPGSSFQSPSSSTITSPPPSLTASKPLNLNLGGFRSFGAGASSSAAPFVSSPVSEVAPKVEKASPPAPKALSGSPPHPLSLTNRVPSISGSPPATAGSAAPALAPQPPKKKFTLKLGPRPAGGGGGGAGGGQASPPA